MRGPRRRARTYLAITASAAVILSGGNAGLIAHADERPNAPRPAAPSAGPVVLVDLGDPGAVGAWVTVNDPVMGGRSTSTVSFDDGGLMFSGTISLDNNGGFASARGPVDPAIGSRASGATALSVRATGDGKTYVLRVDTGQPWSYIQRFSTEAGVPRTYDLPVSGFQPVGRFLDPLPNAPALDPSTIDRVAFYILDKQQGPFRIVVTEITAVTGIGTG